jgi:hypothetical protein
MSSDLFREREHFGIALVFVDDPVSALYSELVATRPSTIQSLCSCAISLRGAMTVPVSGWMKEWASGSSQSFLIWACHSRNSTGWWDPPSRACCPVQDGKRTAPAGTTVECRRSATPLPRHSAGRHPSCGGSRDDRGAPDRTSPAPSLSAPPRAGSHMRRSRSRSRPASVPEPVSSHLQGRGSCVGCSSGGRLSASLRTPGSSRILFWMIQCIVALAHFAFIDVSSHRRTR